MKTQPRPGKNSRCHINVKYTFSLGSHYSLLYLSAKLNYKGIVKSCKSLWLETFRKLVLVVLT